MMALSETTYIVQAPASPEEILGDDKPSFYIQRHV